MTRTMTTAEAMASIQSTTGLRLFCRALRASDLFFRQVRKRSVASVSFVSQLIHAVFEFRAKVASDTAFAVNPRARLDWFYRRSPWADPEQNLLPVARALRAPPESVLEPLR